MTNEKNIYNKYSYCLNNEFLNNHNCKMAINPLIEDILKDIEMTCTKYDLLL